MQMHSKFIRYLVIAVHDKNALRRMFFKCSRPFGQLRAIRMSTDTRQINDLRAHLDHLAEQLDFLRTIQQRMTKCTGHLVTHKQDRRIIPPEIVL